MWDLVICMIQRISRDAESVHSGTTVTRPPVNQRYFLSKMFEEDCWAAPNIMPPNIWNTPFTLGNVFEKFTCIFFVILRKNTHIMGLDAGRIPERTSTGQPVPEDGDGGKGAIPNPRFLRSSSTGNSFDPMKGRNLTNYGVDRQRLQISELYFDKFPTPQTLSCWKIGFKTEVCSCSNFPTEAMLWIKEVEMGTSVNDTKIFAIHSRSYSFSWFWITGRENCIIPEQDHPESVLQDERSVWRNRRLRNQNRFHRGRQIA